MKKLHSLMFAAALMAGTAFMNSCQEDTPSSKNPVQETVASSKRSDTAILLCTFGSTFSESIETYDRIIADFEKAFPGTDVYLSFTSYTCVNRVKAATGIDRYQPDLWLDALGKAGYKKVAVQSLHVIPGEEYLNLMNSDVKKDFMIGGYPEVEVLKGANLIAGDEDVKVIADVLAQEYRTVLDDKKSILLFMGHGNPDENYEHANEKYTDLENAMLARTQNRNVFVGTVDYGEMLFCPEGWTEGQDIADTYVYSKLMNYCKENSLQPGDVTVHLVPAMTVAGDHAHNDMWGIDDETPVSQAKPAADCCWRLKLQYLGFKVDESQSHNGNYKNCTIKGLADFAAIRQVWVSHLQKDFNNAEAWENGADYQ